MLDSFEIVTTSGVVLWKKAYADVSSNLINNLIREVFIEERGSSARADNSGGQKPTYKREGYTLKWTAAKDLGLIFVVCCASWDKPAVEQDILLTIQTQAVYQSLLQITWVDKLLENVRALFTELYRDQLTKPNPTIGNYPFDQYFERQVQELEKLNQDTGSLRSPDIDITPPSSDANNDSAEDMPPPPVPASAKCP